ncbi:hypothetical protein Xbed_00738 [Xenorhabdus beddingii]|uniref:Uncharacterized protein n=1 Tax=Xenorhabdus beddingii TaxID=40578 RepID=A0A1Y2SSC1_9GAMM|nr:hypothetical protein [Xenorhabdus beddingii]OTA21092.1 hypothetical protein Xbed_00738 [Xenorhabdus beddingii]
MSEKKSLERTEDIILLSERELKTPREEYTWHAETFSISEFDDGHGHGGIVLPDNRHYFAVHVIIKSMEGRHTGVSTTLYVNGEIRKPYGSSIPEKPSTWADLDGAHNIFYPYMASHSTTVKLTGYISSLDKRKGGEAKITILGFYDG